MPRALPALLIAIALAWPAATRSAAEDDPVETLVHAGEQAEARGEYAAALRAYEAAFARDPSSRFAPRASARAELLRSHGEGGFAPLARLERVRNDPALASDPAALDALLRDAEAFPDGPVRVEARMLVAEAYLGRLGRPADGMRALEHVLGDRATDPGTRRIATRRLVGAQLEAGDLAAARATAGTFAHDLDAPLAERVRRLTRRQRLHTAAVITLAALAALCALAIGRAARRRELAAVGRAIRGAVPVTLAFGVWVAAMGGGLASAYESGNPRPFLALGAAAFGLALAARAWGAAGARGTLPRVGRAALSAGAALSTALLLLERIEPAYLESFGL